MNKKKKKILKKRLNKITQERFKKAIVNTFGNIMVISQNLDCSRRAVYDYVNKNPWTRPMLKDEEEKLLDLAENKVASKINDGDQKMTRWFLSRKGRHRGYVERIEQEVKTDHTIHYDDAVLEAWKEREQKK